jgi:hypothetical protein
MSRLYASIDSDARKTQATSRGFRNIESHVRGWNLGVRVAARTVGEDDVFDVYVTSGSSGGESDHLVATIESFEGARHFSRMVRDGVVA